MPDDNSIVVRYAIKHLYRGNYGCLVLPVAIHPALLAAASLADLYIFSDKYQHVSLKPPVLAEFDRHADHVAILQALRHIYENITILTQQYRDYFAVTALTIIRMMNAAKRQKLETTTAIGGSFAQDAMKAQMKAFELEAKEMQQHQELVQPKDEHDISHYGRFGVLPCSYWELGTILTLCHRKYQRRRVGHGKVAKNLA